MNTPWQLSPETVLRDGPVIPVIVLQRLEHALPLAKALIAGGIRVLEVTLRTKVALEAIRVIAREVQDAIVGAGTVTSAAELAAVRDAGARFAISPGLTPSLLQAAQQGDLPLIPGIATISELMLGMDYGLRHFKLFPAEVVGGVKLLKAIAGPLPQALFCPTGGITPENAPHYLQLPNVACVGGSWLVPQEALEQGDWARITALAGEASALRPG